MSTFFEINVAIVQFVDTMKKMRKAIDADVAAIHLSSKFPHSGFTIDEIAREIERAAGKAGAKLLSKAEPIRNADVGQAVAAGGLVS